MASATPLGLAHERRLVVDISGHGFGHLSQVAPVVARLVRRLERINVIVRSSLPQAVLARFLPIDFRTATPPPDIGMVMVSPAEVDVEASWAAYRTLHHRWPAVVDREAARLETLGPDLFLSDIGYVGLAAADRSGIPAIAMSSLEWSQVAAGYFGDRPETAPMIEEIESAYQSAERFIQLTPHVAMPAFANATAVGPVARLGRPRRRFLAERLGGGADTRIVLVAFGGIADTRRGRPTPPPIPGIAWLVPPGWPVSRADVHAHTSIDIPFIDLIASCDVVITKLGYGTCVEACCNGARLLYACRPDWPEQEPMAAWLSRHGVTTGLEADRVDGLDIADALCTLLADDPPRPVAPTGVEQAADMIEQRLRSL